MIYPKSDSENQKEFIRVSLSGKRLTDSNEFANELREKKMILPIDVTLRGSPKSAIHALFHANNKSNKIRICYFSTLSLIFLIISFLVARMSSRSTDSVFLRLRTEVSKSPAPSGSKSANGNPP